MTRIRIGVLTLLALALSTACSTTTRRVSCLSLGTAGRSPEPPQPTGSASVLDLQLRHYGECDMPAARVERFDVVSSHFLDAGERNFDSSTVWQGVILPPFS
jgi:hypothetical protein